MQFGRLQVIPDTATVRLLLELFTYWKQLEALHVPPPVALEKELHHLQIALATGRMKP